MLALAAYTFICRRADENPNHSLNIHGLLWVRLCLVPICLLFPGLTIGVCYFSEEHRVDLGLLSMAAFFLTMLMISFINITEKSDTKEDGAQE